MVLTLDMRPTHNDIMHTSERRANVVGSVPYMHMWSILPSLQCLILTKRTVLHLRADSVVNPRGSSMVHVIGNTSDSDSYSAAGGAVVAIL